MSQKTTAELYLEELQRGISPLEEVAISRESQGYRERLETLVSDLAEVVAGGDTRRASALQAEYHRAIDEARRGPKLTPFQDPLEQLLVRELATEIDTIARRHPYYPSLGHVVFGTLRLGQLNAVTIRVPRTDEHLIVFQSGVFVFLNNWTKIIAASFPYEVEQDGFGFLADASRVREHLKRNSLPAQRTIKLLDTYLLEGVPWQEEQFLVPQPLRALSSTLRQSAELFVMGHEYGHLLANHFR
jgi:hypothetical protein